LRSHRIVEAHRPLAERLTNCVVTSDEKIVESE